MARIAEYHTSLQAHSEPRSLFGPKCGLKDFLLHFLCFAFAVMMQLTHTGTVAQQPERPIQGLVLSPGGTHATCLLSQISWLGKFRGERDNRALKRGEREAVASFTEAGARPPSWLVKY